MCCFCRGPGNGRTKPDNGLNFESSFFRFPSPDEDLLDANRIPPLASPPLNSIKKEVVVNTRNSPSDPDLTSAPVPAAEHDDYAASNGDSLAALVIPDNGLSVNFDDIEYDGDCFFSSAFFFPDNHTEQVPSGSPEKLETSSPDSIFSSHSTTSDDEDMDSEDSQSQDFGSSWLLSYPAGDLDSENILWEDFGLSRLFSWSSVGDLDTEDAEIEDFGLSWLFSQSREKRVTFAKEENLVEIRYYEMLEGELEMKKEANRALNLEG